MSLSERRAVLRTALAALTDLDGVLHQASGPELAELMALVDDVASKAGAARMSTLVEALSRGEVAAAGTNAQSWVRDHAPSMRQGGAGQLATVALAVVPAGAAWGLTPDERVDPESSLGLVWHGVLDGSVSPSLGAAVLREMERMDPLLQEEAKPTVTRALLDLGVQWGPAMMRRLRPRLLGEHGAPGVLDDLQGRLAPAARLSAPMVESGDLTEYQLLMTPEQAAALEAAIGPLSAPSPNAETGERDLRPAGQRRVEALTDVCRRSSALDAGRHGGADGAGAAASAVHVLMSLPDLQERSGCGEVLGSSATGTVLAPETVRRIACDADLVPHVLGSSGEPLDLGRVVRLFTRAQRRQLLVRDRGCTYPGCGAPAAWTKVHHVVHWADGGRSDMDNAALLCQRHHTVVHSKRLVAQVRQRADDVGRYVVWDLSPGSYDRHLDRCEAHRVAERARTPGKGLALVSEAAAGWPDDEGSWPAPDDWATDAMLAEARAALDATRLPEVA